MSTRRLTVWLNVPILTAVPVPVSKTSKMAIKSHLEGVILEKIEMATCCMLRKTSCRPTCIANVSFLFLELLINVNILILLFFIIAQSENVF